MTSGKPDPSRVKAPHCEWCGFSLPSAVERVCPSCLAGNPRGSSFCNKCGRRMGGGRGLPVPEDSRPQGGAWLFVAVEGLVEVAQRLGPTLSEAADAFFADLDGRVRGVDGLAEGELGFYRVWFPARGRSGMVGAIERAHQLGQQLRGPRASSAAFPQLRLGLHAGSALALAHDGRWFPVQEAHDAALQLLSFENAGGLLVTAEVARVAAAHLETRPFDNEGHLDLFLSMGWHEAKRPSPAWLEEGLPVACDEDLQHLHLRWAEVQRGEGARFISLMGPDGCGKRRVVEEFLTQVPEGRGVTFAYASASENTRLVPYLPMTELLLKLIDVSPGASEEEARSRLKHAARRACVVHQSADIDGESAEMAALVGQLLGIELHAELGPLLSGLEAEVFRHHAFRAFLKLVQGLTVDLPRVMVIDGLHEADSGTIDLLQYLGGTSRGEGRYLLILLARRDLVDIRPDWARGWWRHEAMEVLGLERDELVELGESIARRTGGCSRALLERLADRAGGDPWFMEQAAFHFSSGGPAGEEVAPELGDDEDMVFAEEVPEEPADLVIPDDIEDLLALRLAALEPQLIRLLEAAAVVGTVVPERLLRGLLEGDVALDGQVAEGLRTLEQRAFLRRRVDEDVYRFRGDLLWRQVLAATSPSDRQAWNRRLARLLEEVHTGTHSRARYAQVALCQERGGNPQAALGLYVLGARRARRVMANDEAQACFDRALKQLRRQDGREVDTRAALSLYLTRGKLNLSMGHLEAAIRDLELAVEYGRLIQETRRECEALLYLSEALDRHGFLDRARRLATSADDLAVSLGDPRLRVLGLRRLGWLGVRAGDLAAARSFLEEAFKMARSEGLEVADVVQSMDDVAAAQLLRQDDAGAAESLAQLIHQLRRSNSWNYTTER